MQNFRNCGLRDTNFCSSTVFEMDNRHNIFKILSLSFTIGHMDSRRYNFIPPPILTDREFEILECVNDGFRRAEVADALGISEETVKFHMKNILRKFGGTRVTDVSSEIARYVEAFSRHGLNYQVHYKKISNYIEVSRDFREAKIFRRSEGIVVRGELREHVIGSTFQGKMQDVRICGKTADAIQNNSSGALYTIYRLGLDTPLKRGQSFLQTFSFQGVCWPNLHYLESTFTIGSPTSEVETRIKFAAGDPRNVEAKKLHGLYFKDASDLPNVNFDVVTDTILFRVVEPKLEEKFTLSWSLD